MKCCLALAVMFSIQVCLADSGSSVSWIKGPLRVQLGDSAQLDVPANFKFADPDRAKAFLETQKSKPAGHVLGLLMHSSGEWFVTFESFDTGRVAEKAIGPLDEAAVMASLQPRVKVLNKGRENRGQPPLTKIGWQTKPSYNKDTHVLEWALRGEGISESDAVLDYTFRILTRKGIVQASATLSRPGVPGGALVADIFGAIAVKPGHRYSDFQPADKAASFTVANLATATVPGIAGTESGPAKDGAKALWISVVVLASLGIVGGGLLARRMRQHRDVSGEVSEDGEQPIAAPVHSGGLKLNGTRQLKFESQPKPARPLSNGKSVSANGGNGNGMKRKRMFNYHKFYTEMVLQGPAPVVGESYNGYDLDAARYNSNNRSGHYANGNGHGNGNGDGNGHSNGNGNGHTNGNGNGHGDHNGNGNGNGNSHSNGNGHLPTPSATAMLNAHSELIATQRSFIEEQKRLIHEQGRLIEEKSKLIAEKNLLLDKQSQLLDNNLV